MNVQGQWYDSNQSTKQQVTLLVDHLGTVNIRESGGGNALLFSGSFDHLDVSSRLGNSARYIYFPQGQKFETRENDAVDQIVQQFAPSLAHTWVHRLESHWRYVMLAVVKVIVFGAWVVTYGVPMSANAIAHALPDSFEQTASEQTLNVLDQQLFAPSELDDSVKDRVRQHFSTAMDQHKEYNLVLLFRSSEIGANAFALPGGVIVFTDDMIKLAENDDELLSVFAHEIGHVVHRHGMRSVIQSSMMGFMLVLLSGDASVASEMLLGIPVLLTQLGYSRAFEYEADAYAYEYMKENAIDVSHFSRLMTRLDHSHRCGHQHNKASDNDNVVDKGEHQDESCEESSQWSKYLSTHPALRERIEKFNKSPQGDH